MNSNMKRIREKNGKTLNDVANESGLNYTTIMRIEKGLIIPKINTAQKIANALNTPIEELFDLKEID
jgi:DNA-binding XRE family transcriptional regulator